MKSLFDQLALVAYEIKIQEIDAWALEQGLTQKQIDDCSKAYAVTITAIMALRIASKFGLLGDELEGE